MCTTLSLGCCCEIALVQLLLYSSLLHLSFSRHESIGEPPVFQSQPEDIMVTTQVLTTYEGIQAHVIITCDVTGDPTPDVTWFRGDTEIYIDGGALKLKAPGTVTETFSLVGLVAGLSLYMNLTAQVVSREPETFHCRASNMLGEVIVATARSKDVHVTFINFNGFENEVTSEVLVPTILGGAAALKCDVLEASPPPEIEWFADTVRVFSGPTASSMIVYVDDGRYLYIRSLSELQRNAKYHCEIANRLGNQRAVAPTTYSLDGDIDIGVVTVYRPLEPIFISLGYTEETPVYYPAAIPRADLEASSLGVVCPSNSNFTSLSTGLLVNFRSRFTDVVEYDLTCVLTGTPILPIPEINFEFIITGPVSITSPLEGASSLIDRSRGVGNAVSYMCEYHGLPTPTLSWYFNGEQISGSVGGIRVDGNAIFIQSPDGRHSGIYQCIVENVITGVRYTDQRAWILEVKDGLIPSFLPLVDTNPTAARDSYLGTLLVSRVNGRVNITIGMNYEHCPKVQWVFNGTNITAGSDYAITNPCTSIGSDEVTTTLYFSLILRRLRDTNSGLYSAFFSHDSISSSSDTIFVTVPVPFEVISFEVEDRGLPCLLSGSNVVLTCRTVGYPRPIIIFTKDGVPIIPGVGDFQRYAAVKFDQIRIRYLEEGDDASYGCDLFQSGGAVTGSRVNMSRLSICIPPLISHNEVTVFTIDMLVINCVASGLPTPEITWTKDTEDLIEDDEHIGIEYNGSTVSRLIINDLTFFDNGIYACVGTSDSGNISHLFPISIGLLEPIQTSLLVGSAIGIITILVVAHVTGVIAVICYLGIKHHLKTRKLMRHRWSRRSTSLKTALDTWDNRSSVYSFYTAVTRAQ